MVGKLEPEQYRKLFIGGLDFKTTDETLKSHFEKWGDIVDVVVMKDTRTKRSKGFGFITYAEESMLDDCQNSRPHKIDGRTVETKRAIPREESGKAESNVTVKKLFVGSIKDDISEDELSDHFSTFGDVISVSFVTEKGTDRKRGFGFVEFEDYDSVDKCILRKHEHIVKGRKLDVKKALSKQQMQEIQSKQNAKQGYGGGGGGGFGDREPWSRDDGGYGGGGSGGGYNQGGGNRGPWGNEGNQWGGNRDQGNWGGQSNWGGNPGGNWGGQGGNWGGNQGGGGGGGGYGGGGYGSGGGNPGWGDQGSGGGNYGSNYQQGYSGGPMRSGPPPRSGPYGQGGGGRGGRY